MICLGTRNNNERNCFIRDFSSFQELANNKQYQELKEVSDFINLDTGVGNSNPFYNPNIIIVE